MKIEDYNRSAWDEQVISGNPWTVPVSSDVIVAARRGEWRIVLTETKPVPSEWFPKLDGLDVLCLASGGGQQAPVLAAAGARVTVFDNSARQLEQDRLVAEREGLDLRTVQGDMAKLDMFANESFGLVFNPCSNLFVPDVLPVWQEAYRVLRKGGILMSGFLNPILYIFDRFAADRGELVVRHPVPYADSSSQTEEELKAQLARNEPLEFSHTLTALLGGQLEAGFVITHLYEDHYQGHAVSSYHPTYLATRAVKGDAMAQ